jgi:hypothetical protein
MKKFLLILAILFVLTACNTDPQSNEMPEEIYTDENEVVEAVITPDETPFLLASDMSKAMMLAWFYKPPQLGSLQDLASDYDFFIFTQNDENEIDELSRLGSNGLVLQYFRVNDIQNIGDCSKRPFQNQVAYHPGDFCNIIENHDEWFLHDPFNRLIESDQYYLMDSGNRDWQEFFVTRVKESQSWPGWDGIFLDNVEASFSKRQRVNGMPSEYADEEAYIASIESFLHYFYANFAYPNQKPVYANIIEMRNPEIWFRYLDYLDGAMIEAFAVDWTDGYLDQSEWEMQLKIAEITQSLGKGIILVAQGDRNDLHRQNFSMASYLLINNGNAYFRFSNDRSYDEIWVYDIYEMELGLPINSRYYQDGKWIRDFENGRVWVNPENHDYGIELK